MKKFADEYMRAGLNVVFTHHWMQEKVAKMLKPLGVSEQQYNVLRILKGQKGNPINLLDVQSRMLHKMSNATRLVEKLRLKGYVDRVPCPTNRRKVEITITQKGLDFLIMADPITESDENNHFKNLTEKEAGQLSDLLEKLRG